jgi:hypothetical protein
MIGNVMQHSYSITNICTPSVLQGMTKHFETSRLCGLMKRREIWAKLLVNTYGNVPQSGCGHAHSAPKSTLALDGGWDGIDVENAGPF